MTDQALADFRQREISCLFLLQLSGREPDYVSYLSQYIYDPSPVSYTHLDVYKRQSKAYHDLAQTGVILC